MMCGLLSSYADPTSAPPAEQIPMGYEEHSVQGGTTEPFSQLSPQNVPIVLSPCM